MGFPKPVEHREPLVQRRGRLRQPASEDPLENAERSMNYPAVFALPQVKLRLRVQQIELGKQRYDATEMVRRPCQYFERPKESV